MKTLEIKRQDKEAREAKDAKDSLAIKNHKIADADESDDDYEVYGKLKTGFKRPIIIHRAILGSFERFFAIITEHFGGKWPFWLNPKQIMVVPISEKYNTYATQIRNRFDYEGFNAFSDISKDTLNKKVRNAQIDQYNYILVVGEQEVLDGTATLRERDQEKPKGTFKILELLKMFNDLNPKPSDVALAKK